MEFVSYLVVFFVAMYIGWHLRGIVFLANLSENPDRVIKMLERIKEINEEEAKGNIMADSGVEVTAEHVQGYWYAYAKENGEFLGQGPTFDDALKSAGERFPGKKFWCNNQNNLTNKLD